jgi:hypothetical protein
MRCVDVIASDSPPNFDALINIESANIQCDQYKFILNFFNSELAVKEVTAEISHT